MRRTNMQNDENMAEESRRSVLAGKLGFAAYRAGRPADSGVLS